VAAYLLHPIRKAVGISGAYWVYVGLSTTGLLLTAVILSRKTVADAIAAAKAVSAEGAKPGEGKPAEEGKTLGAVLP